jgi:hypothetical protein
VLPLNPGDIRAEREGSDGEPLPSLKELVIPMKPPSLRDGERVPCQFDGGRFYDVPFRDGAHAYWDAKQLGDPPIFVIAPDGTSFSRSDWEKSRNSGDKA